MVQGIVCGISLHSIALKRSIERYKDYKIQKNIHNKLKPPDTNQESTGPAAHSNPLRLNNMRHNPAMLTGVQIACVVLLLLLLGLFQMLLDHSQLNNSLMDYKIWLFPKLLIETFLFRIVIPILHICHRKDLRQFIRAEIEHMGLLG